MTPDYPDYTRAQQIIGSDIMVPIDIQGSYIMMPVDIQAQYVTLQIDIVAQTIGNLAVNIAANTAGNITVNIAAQSLSNLNINLNAQSVAIMYGGEWGVVAGGGKSTIVIGSSINYGSGAVAYYTVTTGKVLFINALTFTSGAHAAASGDLPQIGYCYIMNFTDSVYLALLGGNGGGGITFPSPLRVSSGKVVSLAVANYANHAVDMFGCWQGWEQ